LAPLGESANGPEIGYDKDVGYEVAVCYEGIR
jgi:hypothetical protein